LSSPPSLTPSRTPRTQLGDANADAAEVITNMRLVRAFSTEEAEKAKYGHKCDISLRRGITDAFYGTLTVTLGAYLDQGASVIILWCGGATAMVVGSNLSVGRLITYTLYYNRIQNSYNALNGVLNSFTRAAGAAMRVLSLFDLEPAIPSTDPSAGAPLAGGAPDAVGVQFENVDFHYQMRPDRKVLSGFSLTIPPGTVTALVGKSGAGKSTTAGLLLRFYDVKGGRVLIDGVDLRSLNLASFHKALGVVTQDTQLFNQSIEENITYGLAVRARVAAAARLPATLSRGPPADGRMPCAAVSPTGCQQCRVPCVHRAASALPALRAQALPSDRKALLPNCAPTFPAPLPTPIPARCALLWLLRCSPRARRRTRKSSSSKPPVKRRRTSSSWVCPRDTARGLAREARDSLVGRSSGLPSAVRCSARRGCSCSMRPRRLSTRRARRRCRHRSTRSSGRGSTRSS
jgi:ABC-type oligopeptide transport system ATPase subunit